MSSSMENKRIVVHLITGLGKGGAETMLYQIAKYKSDSRIQHIVVSMGLTHFYEQELIKLHVKVIDLNIRNKPISAIIRLKKICKKNMVMCCWMYVSCLFGTLIGIRHAGRLIWCIRHSDLSRKNNSLTTIVTSRLCARISDKADLITYNGYRALSVHREAGYHSKSEIVLSNGLDIDEYRKSFVNRRKVRLELCIKDDDIVVLSVARDNPIKDLPTFIRTFSEIKKNYTNARALMCGNGVDDSNARITKMIEESGMRCGEDIILLGFREDISALMSASDIYVLHSAGEAFPNILIQAMACETLVVSTDVGDVVEILGDDTYVTSPGDYKALARKTIKLLSLSEQEKEQIRKKNRKKIETKYNIKQVVKSYEELFVS